MWLIFISLKNIFYQSKILRDCFARVTMQSHWPITLCSPRNPFGRRCWAPISWPLISWSSLFLTSHPRKTPKTVTLFASGKVMNDRFAIWACLFILRISPLFNLPFALHKNGLEISNFDQFRIRAGHALLRQSLQASFYEIHFLVPDFEGVVCVSDHFVSDPVRWLPTGEESRAYDWWSHVSVLNVLFLVTCSFLKSETFKIVFKWI